MKVSVVIPTKNRSKLLADSIDHIEAQTFPREQYEVIVVDNNSSDDTRAVLGQKAAAYPNLRVGSQEIPGAAATRNVGIRMARGELVLFVDDDVQAEPSLIQEHVGYHEKHADASVIGSIVLPWDDAKEPFLRYLRDRGLMHPYTPSKGPIDFSCYHTCNASTPTRLLRKVGGFSETFRIYGMEDIELGYRLEKAGSRMVFASGARALHYRFPQYRDFVDRCEQAGYSLGQLLTLHPELKDRFVENGWMTRYLKSIHALYRCATVVLKPFLSLLTRWEERRGSGRVGRFMDTHYSWALRYHFFLGYQRYMKDHDTRNIRKMEAAPPRLADKPGKVKAEGPV